MPGLDADINVKGMAYAELAKAICASGILFDQLIMEYDDWVHFGLPRGAPRHELLTIHAGTSYMQGIV